MTAVDKSWQLAGGRGPVYALFDGLRRWLNGRLTRFLAGQALEQGGWALEAGSGPGAASSMLNTSPGVRAIALDYDPQALAAARVRDPALPLVVADVRALPFRAGAFALVWNSSTLEHLPEMAPALAEMQRVTRPGGAVFVGVPAADGPLGFQRWIARSGVGVWIGTVFSAKALRQRLQAAGLQTEREHRYFFRFFVGILARRPGD
jgi:ubiquinone/menaquinone biosynthesis C-methylase UbiE